MLPSPRDIATAVLEADGIGSALAPGTLYIDMSTSTPDLARELARSLPAVDVLDAPVSGGTIGANAGTLTVMVGGERAAVKRARPILDALGSRVVHVGGHGHGQAAKLCNNVLAGVNMAAIAQAAALAEREGIDQAVFYDLVTASTGDSRVLRTRYPAPVSESTPASHGFAPMFTVDLMAKDLSLAEQLAREHGLPLGALGVALDAYRHGQARGLGDLDYSAIAMLTGAVPLDRQLEALRMQLDVQRVTLRVDVPGDCFPVHYESRAPGTLSLRGDTLDMTRQPVPRVLEEQGGQVVQDDAAAAFPGHVDFHEMRERFGGMRAQVVTGAYRGERLVALLSVHDLVGTRTWSDAETTLLRKTATRLAEALDDDA